MRLELFWQCHSVDDSLWSCRDVKNFWNENCLQWDFMIWVRLKSLHRVYLVDAVFVSFWVFLWSSNIFCWHEDRKVNSKNSMLNLPYLPPTSSGVIEKASGQQWIMKTKAWTTATTWIQAGNWSILARRHGWVRLMLRGPKHLVTSGYTTDVSKCIRWCCYDLP